MELNRIVVKVGTNVLTLENGRLDLVMISELVTQLVDLKRQGKEVILISSGAVGAGRSVIQLPEKLNPVTKRQVYASIGQVELMNRYTELFREQGMFCAQVLATKEDFRDRTHFVNMKRCLLALLRDNVVPIMNENDVIAISELMFTDNDELAALTASLVNADALVILSNVDGVLDENRQVIPLIHAADTAVYDKLTPVRSSFGRGGMVTKLRMCQQAARLGIHTFIANGKKIAVRDVINRNGATCTYFPAGKKRSGLKRWMAHRDGMEAGRVVVNEGAASILSDDARSASLLPVGIIRIDKPFKKGDLIGIANESGDVIGMGVAGYGSRKLERIIGTKGVRELIHYDYLLIW